MEKLIFLLLLLTIVLTSCTTSTEPKAPGEIVDDLLNTHALEKENAQLFIRVFKYEEELECWGKAKGATTWKLLKTYLSLGLNYPNESDRIRGDRIAPGSDIFIHGACITVGCIPLTDPLIEEVFLMAEMARDAGQKHIPVHIFPGRMDAKRFLRRMETSDHESFWQELTRARLFSAGLTIKYVNSSQCVILYFASCFFCLPAATASRTPSPALPTTRASFQIPIAEVSSKRKSSAN